MSNPTARQRAEALVTALAFEEENILALSEEEIRELFIETIAAELEDFEQQIRKELGSGEAP